MGEVMILLQDQHLDILFLTETWLSKEVGDEFLAFPGYTVVRCDREHRRGGGVAFLHRDEIALQTLAVPKGGPLETLWAIATWPGGRPTTLGVVYRPPDSPLSAGLSQLEDLLREAAGAGRPMFALGDLNINVLDTGSSNTRRYLAIIDELNLQQLVDAPTHLHPTPSALDHVITNMTDTAPETIILTDTISDHQPTVTTAYLPRVRKQAKWRISRNWRRVDWNAVCLEFLSANCTQVDGATDVNTCVNHFMELWNTVLDRHCPQRRVRVARPSCPWLSDDPAL